MKKLLGIALTSLVVSTAQAGQITLPTTLDQLLITGNFFVVAGDTFDTFTYDPMGSPPPASGVNVLQFDAGDEHGFTLPSGFIVSTDKQNVDYQLTYVLHGIGFTDATLSGIFTGNGTGSVEETLLSGNDNSLIGTMEISSKGPNSETLTFGTPIDGPIVVQVDIILNGSGSSIGNLNQGFSPAQAMGVPEPASVISLATGIAIVLVTLTMRGRVKSR